MSVEMYKKTLYGNPSDLLYKLWRDKIPLTKPHDFKTIIEPFSVHLDFYITNINKKDLDNLVKGALDLLKDRRIIYDDNLCYNIKANKYYVNVSTLEKTVIKILPVREG